MGRVFSPLDERLQLLPTAYSPFLVEAIVRLGTRLPFAQVAEEMALLFGVSVSVDTIRRLTEQAGALQVAIEQRELDRLEHEAPPDPDGPAVQQVSVDGAMAPMVGGGWTEVRTMAIGTVHERHGAAHATDLHYFSRHGSASEFIRQATLPTYERGTRQAGTVVAISDGAGWIQELIDEQCPTAVRILDFPHAVGYLSRAAQAALGIGSREAAVWLDEWAPTLKTEKPEAVIAAIRALPSPTPEAASEKRTAVRYLTTRLDQIRYADFQRHGYPIGSGIVESANKLVVEQRLKGAGMHWAPKNINPILALRGRLCSGQWGATWAGIVQAWRAQVVQRRNEGRSIRQAQRAVHEVLHSPTPAAVPSNSKRTKSIVNGRPTPNHPWKQRRGSVVA
ncbi:MAG: hypothetical protein NVS2B16_35510 [Chloroflexota bacterium]